MVVLAVTPCHASPERTIRDSTLNSRPSFRSSARYPSTSPGWASSHVCSSTAERWKVTPLLARPSTGFSTISDVGAGPDHSTLPSTTTP